MAPENVEFVRKPLRARERSRRTLDQRLAIRFPRLTAAFARLIGKLPPGSRVRQAALWRTARLGVEAYNRRDLDAVVIAYRPDLEYYPYREFVEAALAEPCYHGPSGYRAYIEATYEVWGTEVRRRSSSTWGTGSSYSQTCRCAPRRAVFRWLRRTRVSRRSRTAG
jgi:hypothetical protein